VAGTVEVERLNAEKEIARDVEPDHEGIKTEPHTKVNKNFSLERKVQKRKMIFRI